MLTIRATYDGQTFRPLPFEPLPEVEKEIPVAIVFLEDVPTLRQDPQEVARRMRAARERMQPLGVSVKDLVEEGRER